VQEGVMRKTTKKTQQCIMLVDSDRNTIRSVYESLNKEGFEMVVVTDGESAAKLTNKIKPDLVIMDEMEPGRDDVKTIDDIREHSNVPIIMLNQEYNMEKLWVALSHGADDYIQKPFGLSVLVARVRAKLRRAGPKSTLVHN
jgi:DNA-binding response OmpR family regulator